MRCLFEGAPANGPTCAQAGVLGSMAGVIGGLQAELAFARRAPETEATLHVVDGAAMRVRHVTVTRAPDCPACAAGTAASMLGAAG